MEIKIDQLKKVFIEALALRGLSRSEAEIVAEPFVEAELAGKKTHGISKFLLIDEAIRLRQGKPEIVKDVFNYALIDAHKELGYLSAQFATDVLIRKAHEFGNAMVATVNSYHYSMAGIYARKVAKAGFISVMTNNGGPSAVTPFGGVDPILGTNPIAIGIPFKGDAIVLDMATSKQTWGEINLAKIEGRELEPDTFFDKEGKITIDPQKAVAIRPFGEAKGGGLNVMLEILTGAFVGAKMGLASRDGYDLGFLFMAYSPDMFTSRDAFESEVEQLVKEIKFSRPESEHTHLYLPGEISSNRVFAARRSGVVEIGDSSWEKLEAFARGEDVKADEGLVE